jgi:hypothetical protein
MDVKLDTVSGDIDLSTGDVMLVDGADAIIQHLHIRLRFFLGEWFLDTRLGVPYFQKLLGHRIDNALIQSIFRKAVLGTPGVKAVRSLSVDFENDTRKLFIRFSAILAGSAEPVRFEEELII